MPEVNLSHDTGREGPLARFAGALPPAPAWFARAIAHAPRAARVTVEGAGLRTLAWGDPARPGLLLVHGNGAHAGWWSFIAPFLAAECHVVAMDLSGMGEAEHRARYTMELFAAETVGVCEAAGMFANAEPPIIVGHSFGGFVTILAGALSGKRLAGVVIVDAPVNPPERGPGGPPQRTLRPHRVYPDIAAGLARFRLAPEQPCENDFLLDHVARGSLKPVAGGFSWKFDPMIWQHFSIGDTAMRLRSIACRIAIIRGEQSVLLPAEVGDYMFHLLGRAAPVIAIPEAQHHVMLDQPLAFVAALRALLADWNHSTPHRRPG